MNVCLFVKKVKILVECKQNVLQENSDSLYRLLELGKYSKYVGKFVRYV